MSHGLHLPRSAGLGSHGIVEVESVAHLAILVFTIIRVFPRTLDNIKCLPLSLEVIEELGVGEEESEGVVRSSNNRKNDDVIGDEMMMATGGDWTVEKDKEEKGTKIGRLAPPDGGLNDGLILLLTS